VELGLALDTFASNLHTISGPNDYRIYYACIEYDNHTVPGRCPVPSPTLVLVHASLIAHFAQTGALPRPGCWLPIRPHMLKLDHCERPLLPSGFGSMSDRLCLARSQDGVNWHKPSLGVTPFPSNIMVSDTVLVQCLFSACSMLVHQNTVVLADLT
jgi:hypothetical protein